VADTHLSFEEFQCERNRKLIDDKITGLIATLTNVSEDTREKLLDAIGERLEEYGGDQYLSGTNNCSCRFYGPENGF
jgi:hypothetical protein